MGQMRDNLRSKSEQVVDARGPARFAGQEAEREGVRPGHMPGAKNLPYANLFNADGTWKQGEALRAEFEKAGVDVSKPMVTTCGSGITAAVLSFGRALLGEKPAPVYDGSWTEWGSSATNPVVTGG
jgi:thiosulfate/3-mercaptopyruvate sulfurtransferase